MASRPDERRRYPRHTATAIVYVHLGSDNGGIIINLGIDGVACQAARKLTARKNSVLNVRLRGSGLDVNLVGEIIWQGASQKEIGIRFKDLPASQQQVIADWIARQEQVSKAPPVDDFPPPKPMPGMPEVFAPGAGYVPRSYSAAFPLPQTKPADSSLGAVAGATDLHLPPPVDSAGGISASTPHLEIVSPIQDGSVASDGLAAQAEGRNGDALASPEPFQTAQPLRNHVHSDLAPTRRPLQARTRNLSPIVLAKEPISPVRKGLPQASAETPVKAAARKIDETNLISQGRVSPPLGNLSAATAAERWIPPALLAAWRGGNQQEKIVLACSASACFLVLVLILALAVTHISGGSPQQLMARPAASIASTGFPQSDPPRAPALAPWSVATDPNSDEPPPSLLERFAETFLGYKPERPEDEAEIRIPIDKNHVGVQVWTSKGSGYYYCTDNSYYIVVQPGAFMTQRDALQSGYQPKLGRFCN